MADVAGPSVVVAQVVRGYYAEGGNRRQRANLRPAELTVLVVAMDVDAFAVEPPR